MSHRVGETSRPAPLAVMIVDSAVRILDELDRLRSPNAHDQRTLANRACLSLQMGRFADAARFLGELCDGAGTEDERREWQRLASALPAG